MDPLYEDGTVQAVRTLTTQGAVLADLLALDSRPDIARWHEATEQRLLPRLAPDFPLVAAVCGGGSSGKSTLFNALIGEAVSPTGGRAGINRRMLVAVAEPLRERNDLLTALFDPFGTAPQPLEDAARLTVPGDPLLHFTRHLPAGIALVDTPDFDTGAKGDYRNRGTAEQALAAADVLIYIFTNANYNNRDNTDFIARMLTTVGMRRCFLVYRADSGIRDPAILAHAATVGQNLYGDAAGEHILGVYRADEDNRVAAGEHPVRVVPVGGAAGLLEAMAEMDPRRIRSDLQRSIFRDVVDQAERYLGDARDARTHLTLYLQALDVVQQQCVRAALGHLPMDQVVRRFSEIWQAGEPAHIRIMRQTGTVVEAPLRLMMQVARWAGGRPPDGGHAPGEETAATMAADLVKAAGRLRQAAVDPAIEVTLAASNPAADTLREGAARLSGDAGIAVRRSDAGQVSAAIPRPRALADVQQRLQAQTWKAVVDDMLDRQASLLQLTSQLETELQRLADEQRARMTTRDQIRQTLSAMLNIIPATAAVTYVLHTGDPVGAVGIKVKLVGLFGLNDLYALVAIPATTGMKKADLKQLQQLLAPVARAWLTHKLTAIDRLFEEMVTGTLRAKGRDVAAAADERLASMNESLMRCRRALEEHP